jgi:AAA15 family ATPase/GTPase
MRLKSFRIKNFKSIIDTGECHLSAEDNILVLAGQNEAGKSAVIEALNFFGNGVTEDFERLHRRRNEHPEVVCKFRLNDEDIENVFIETKDQKLKKYLQKNPVVGFVRGNVEEDSFEEVFFSDDTTEALNKFFPVESDEGEKSEEVSQAEQPAAANTGEKSDEDEEDSPSITSIEALEEFLFNESRDFVFYDVFSDLLPGVVTIEKMKDYPAVLDFEKVFGANFSEAVKQDERAISREEQRLHREASDNLNTYWKQKLEEGGKYNFNIKIVPQEVNEKQSKIEFKIDRDDGDPLFMEQKSKGFRWFSAFNLKLRALGVDKVKIKNLVILVDEPGQGLHEKAQKDVKMVLEELAQKNGAQIIYTTHHPNLIGTEGVEFARIRVVSNTKESGTKVETAAQYASRADQGAKDTLSPLITAMGIHSIHSVLDTRRLNVVVEGISDHYYFSAFKKLLNKDERLYFLPACGVNNVPNLVSVLIGWGCNYKAVFDDDPKSGRAAYTLLKNEFYEKSDDFAHEHILKIKDCDGIEDIFSKKDFFTHVLDKTLPRKKDDRKNSKLTGGKKELLARLFLEKAESGSIKLTKDTEKKVNEVFGWIYNKFSISDNEVKSS